LLFFAKQSVVKNCAKVIRDAEKNLWQAARRPALRAHPDWSSPALGTLHSKKTKSGMGILFEVAKDDGKRIRPAFGRFSNPRWLGDHAVL